MSLRTVISVKGGRYTPSTAPPVTEPDLKASRTGGDPGRTESGPPPPHNETGHTWHHDNQYLFDYTKLGGKALFEARGLPETESGMPGSAEDLTDDAIWDILAYIRSTWSDRIRRIQATTNPRHQR